LLRQEGWRGIESGAVTLNIEDGWVPRRLVYEGDVPILELVLRGRAPLVRPFLDQDLSGRRQTVRIPLEDFETGGDAEPRLCPTGFVFHMSKAGSTVVARMLGSLERAVVLSEPDPLKDLFSSPHVISEELLVRRLRTLVGVYARALRARDQALCIKWTSWTILRLPIIQKAFAGVPCAFVHRNPAEVMVSILERPPGWLTARAARGQLLGLDPATPVKLSDVEFCARVLARFCRAAADAPEPLLPVSYADLPDAVRTQVMPFFHMAVTENDRLRMLDAARFDTKDAHQRRVFRPDSQEKQSRVTPRILEYADRLVAPAVAALCSRYATSSARISAP
jgi:hypothetical protein